MSGATAIEFSESLHTSLWDSLHMNPLMSATSRLALSHYSHVDTTPLCLKKKKGRLKSYRK